MPKPLVSIIAMVTGVEAAGLALASFPLIIEGLKIYLAGLETIRRWRHYVKTLGDLVRRVSMERRKFKNTCTELLWDLVGADELESLLESPGVSGWKDVQASLRERLEHSFDDFLKAVIDMAERLNDLKEKLELNDNGKVSNDHLLDQQQCFVVLSYF